MNHRTGQRREGTPPVEMLQWSLSWYALMLRLAPGVLYSNLGCVATKLKEAHLPKSKNARSDYGYYPVNPRVCCEPEPFIHGVVSSLVVREQTDDQEGLTKQSDADKRRADNDRWQLVFRLSFWLAGLLTALFRKPIAGSLPYRRARHCQNHRSNEQPHEAQPNLPQVEAVVVREDEREGAEEQVQDAEKNGGVEIQDKGHGLIDQYLERPNGGVLERSPEGFFGSFQRCSPSIVSCFFLNFWAFLFSKTGSSHVSMSVSSPSYVIRVPSHRGLHRYVR